MPESKPRPRAAAKAAAYRRNGQRMPRDLLRSRRPGSYENAAWRSARDAHRDLRGRPAE